jgi:hypothetical protein
MPIKFEAMKTSVYPKFCAALLACLGLGTLPSHAEKAELPDASDPLAGMGVNIHFTDAKPGELEMLSRAGFRWIRTDLTWSRTEGKTGSYDFSIYDRLLASLDKFHIRTIFVLDYGNGLYDNGLPPHTDEGRAAFARWSVAAVTHFKDRGVLWEIWNEPNGNWFWKPHQNAEDYTKLALAVNQALHQAVPEEMMVGPALYGTHLDFIDTLGRAGVLADWSALTIHPYLRGGPETYGPTYDQARTLIKKYAPPGQRMDLLCGESGYTSVWKGTNEVMQGKYLARLYLFDVFSGIPVTIWYDWHEDGPDPQNVEHHFGIVHSDYQAGAANVYEPKPAYDSARTYSQALDGYRFQKRIETKSQGDFVLSFAKEDKPCLVAWTTSLSPHSLKIPAADGIYLATSFDGKTQREVAATGGVIVLKLDDGPQYLKPR